MTRSIRRHALVAVALVLTACAKPPVAELSPGIDPVSTRWNAILATPEAMRGIIQGQGRAWATSVDAGRRTKVNVEMSNMVPGGVHPWIIRTGQCGMGGSEVLSVTDSHQLKIGDDGKAAADVTTDSPFQNSGQYMIAVLASSENRDQVIACGNLAPPVNATR